jgi:polyhydroxybutyrate depolymerase
MTRLHYLLSGLAALATLGPAPVRARAQSSPAAKPHTLRVASVERSYMLYVPTGYQASHPAPLVLVFHGAGGYPRQMARATRFTYLAEREGFVVAYPAGLERRWNDGRRLFSSDDIGFVRALLDTLGHELSIDPRRIYATGISNGAMFSYRLACDLPGVLAAIAPVAGAMPAAIAVQCAQAVPVALAAFQGTEDRLVPYSGGNVATHRGEVMSARASVERWATLAGCTGAPTVTDEPDRVTDGTRVKLSAWSGCQNGRDVQLYTIEGGGHTWPGGPGWAGLLGRTTRDLDATTTIWSFFAAHPKP